MARMQRSLYRVQFVTEKPAGRRRVVSVAVRHDEGDTYVAIVSVCRCEERGQCSCPALMRAYDLPDATVDEVVEHIVGDIDDERVVSTLLCAAEQIFARQDSTPTPRVNVPPGEA